MSNGPLGISVELNALATLGNGDLIVGGRFVTAGGVSANSIARWDGSTWSPFGAGLGLAILPGRVRGLAVMPDGDLLACGDFATTGSSTLANLARWNGSTWSTLGAGQDKPASSMVVGPRGDVLLGGDFLKAGNGGLSPSLATLSTTCPATAVPTGLGCASSGGSNTLTAATLPWVESTFRANGTGLPPTAIVLTLTSFTSVPQGIAPLTILFPQAGPGCDVLVGPDILGALVTTTGSAQSELFLPNVPPLVGLSFFHQMVPIEIGAGGAWTAVTATNALQLTAGMF